MDNELPPIPPTEPSSDPFAPYPDDLAARRSRWPIVFGSISLVYAVLGTCVQGIGAGMSVASDKIMKMSGMEVSPAPKVVQIVGGVQAGVLVILGIVLITGSAMTLLRKPLGVTLMRFWAFARLVMVIVGLVAGIVTLKPQVEWQITMTSEMRESMRNKGIKEEQLPPIPEREATEQRALWAIAGASLAFAIWPFVIAIALSRANVRADQAAWGQPSGATVE